MFKLGIKGKTMLVIIGSLLVGSFVLPIVFKASPMIAVMLFLLLLITVWGVLSYFYSPFSNIINAMSRFSSGDLTVQIDIKRKDEFGELSNVLNASGNLQ